MLETILSQRCYEVIPFVVIVSSDFVPTINTDEVEQVLYVPISVFLNEEKLFFQKVLFGTTFVQVFYQVDKDECTQTPIIDEYRLCYIIFGMTGKKIKIIIKI